MKAPTWRLKANFEYRTYAQLNGVYKDSVASIEFKTARNSSLRQNA